MWGAAHRARAACSSSDEGSSGATAPPGATGGATITYLVASTDPAAVKLEQDTVAPWETRTGNKVKVVAAADIDQQLTQAFAAGSPPDLFVTDATVFPTDAKAGNLVAYGD